jgi:3-deoxy-D-manno-octulosonate 8-phosphate phosphatase (KDO 8-P phosphatase)
LISDFRFCSQASVNVPRSKTVKPGSSVRKSAWAGIRLFAMDVDGVLTDGRVHIHSNGGESKAFSILDGMGLVRLRKAGVELAWISGRQSGATTVRATELQIPHLIQGRTDKLMALQELASRLQLKAAEVCYMGDDDIDAPAMAWAGIGVAPGASMPAALAAADFVPGRAAGHGAVREVCEQILSARDQRPQS